MAVLTRPAAPGPGWPTGALALAAGLTLAILVAMAQGSAAGQEAATANPSGRGPATAAAEPPAEPPAEAAAGATQAPSPTTPSPTTPPPVAAGASSAGVQDSLCLMIEAAATSQGVPIGFFTRLIGQESSFRPDAVGPVTRSGAQAQGIAQFMPSTAAERGLLDPFDPVQALPRSAEYLRDLKQQFGNWGLAAAAYNAGPRRVADWLADKGGLPFETQRYVLSITSRPAEDWRVRDASSALDADFENRRGTRPQGLPVAEASCETIRTALKAGRSVYLAALERRVIEGIAQPWGVQLAAGFSRAKALAAFSLAERRFAGVLGGADAMILRSTFRSRGTRAFYQVRAGQPTRQEAERLCGRLRAVGGACLVLRNGRGGRTRNG
jgi:soluble lytic murein transglycosylase-like protein